MIMGMLSSDTNDYDTILNQVCLILENNLGLEPDSLKRANETLLLGEIPELDSMAIVTVLNSIESHFGFIIDDDEVSADMLTSLGDLVDFINKKITS